MTYNVFSGTLNPTQSINGWQEGHPACKKIWGGDDGGGHWLVRMEWCPDG